MDKSDNQVYLLDPSFHKYARMKDLPEYHVLNIQDTLSFEKDKSHDVSFGVDQAMPLYIRNDSLLSFAVTSVDGKFDRDNFILVISANRRFKFAGRDIVVIGRRNKEFEDFEDKAILNQLLTSEEIKTLFDKLKNWLEKI
jgi:glutamate 5-kinase